MKIKKIKNGNLNSVFKLKLGKYLYTIRASDFDNRFESEVLKILEKYNINAPRIKTHFLFNKKYVMICNYIFGRNPLKYTNDFFDKLITEVKKIHHIDINEINMSNCNIEDIKKLKEYYDIAIESKFLKAEENYLFSLVNKMVKNLNFDKLPKCLIHSDIKKENILINDKKVYIIDFGNCYIGNRLIEIIRIFMWFFILDENYNFNQMQQIANSYFNDNYGITKIEVQNVKLLIEFCLLYNLLKDIYLYKKKLLHINYIKNNSLLWLKALKDKEKILKIEEMFLDVARFTK